MKAVSVEEALLRNSIAIGHLALRVEADKREDLLSAIEIGRQSLKEFKMTDAARALIVYVAIVAVSMICAVVTSYAQTWQCFSGTVACAPGSPNCTCSQIPQPLATPMAPVAPNCPVMTFWNGVTCQVPAALPVDPSYYLLQQQLVQQQIQQQEMQRRWEMHRLEHLQQPGTAQPHLR